VPLNCIHWHPFFIEEEQGEKMIKIVLILTIIAVDFIFLLQNEVPVALSFLFWRFETSLGVVIFFAVLSGVLVMQLLQWGEKKRWAKS
jgi:uncharacterized integral membrane protein